MDVILDIMSEVSTENSRTQMAQKPPPDFQALLEFNNINLSIKTEKGKKKQILQEVSGYARPGELTVIMGPTGSGKTSLLSCLAKRNKKFTGDVLINGEAPTRHYKRQVGFVMQDDVLFASLTVYQTLLYTAKLRLGNLSSEEQIQKVEDIIEGLGLGKARETMIGGEFFRGVSGGERKRVNIANEMLTNPSLILLDEPTSGLDTSTALSLIQMLKGMAESGLTIVTTIHQPSSQMWSLFDNLLLLVEGQCIYFGKASESLTYFDSIGLKCEQFWNPADFIMGIILSEEVAKKKGKSLKEQLVLTWKEKSQLAEYQTPKQDLAATIEEFQTKHVNYSGSYSLNFFEQIYVLTVRAWYLNFGRIYDIFAWFQTIFIALLIGVIWFQTDFDTESYIQRGALIFVAYTYIAGFNPAFEALFQFPMDRAVVVRERASGSYRLSAYYISKLLIEIPWYFPSCIIFVLIFYFMTNLQYAAGPFFATFFVIILCMFVSSSFGLMISAVTLPNTRLAMTALTVLMMTFLITGGFFIQDYPIWMNWIQYTSYFRYSYNALISIQSRDALFLDNTNFTETNNVTNYVIGEDNNTYVPGNDLATYYFVQSPFPYDAGWSCLILLGFGWSFRILGFFALSLSIKRNNNLA